MQRTKPPFRADHVGSFLRTAPIKEARHEAREGRDHGRAAQGGRGRRDQEDHRQAGGVRPEARDRRRVPPLLVALRFPLRPRRRGDEADRARHPVRRRADQGGAAGHRRQDRLLRPSDDRALQVPGGEHARHAEDDDPLADAAAFPLRPRLDHARRSIPTSTCSSTISATTYAKVVQGVLRRRLPLPAVRRHHLGVPLLREGARAVAPARRQSGRAAGEVRRR